MKSNLKIALVGIVGSGLEVYDFVLYGTVATILASHFFPSQHSELSLLYALGTFALGYVARPLGAIFFGYLGDRWGRKKTLALSIFFMAVPTFMIGILPTYETIGVAAPVLLITCRIFQGIGMSGEFNGAIIFLVEHFGRQRASFATSLVFMGVRAGALLALLMGSLCTHPAVPSLGWRIPFIFGSILGLVGFYVRLTLDETPPFKKEVQEAGTILRVPIRTALTHYPSSVLCCLFGSAFDGALGTTIFTYFNLYLTKVVHIPIHYSLFLSSFSLLFYILIDPFVGLLADKVGRAKLMRIGCIGVFCTAYPVFSLLHTGYVPYILLAQVLFVVFAILFGIPFNAQMTHLFPTNARYSGIAFSYNVGTALMGGTMPVIVMYLMYLTHNELIPAFYLMFGSLMGLVVTWGSQRILQQERGAASIRLP